MLILEATSSVTDDVRGETHAAVENSVGQLKRGDEFILAPLTSDAPTEAAGRVLRLKISNDRKAYDADLKQARAKLNDMLSKLRDDAVARPYKHTDLLGTVRMAAEERNIKDERERFALIILSDLLHDTSELNFVTARELASEEAARKLAGKLAGDAKAYAGARVFLGLLRLQSDD